MARDEKEVSITIHGLPADNGNVRAEVFLEKMRALLVAIKLSDSLLNGKKTHNVIIVGLEIGSASVRLREKVSVRKGAPQGSVQLVGQALKSIYNGDVTAERFSPQLIDSLKPLTKGIDKNFSHGDVAFSGENIIRIDDFMARQMSKASEVVRGVDPEFKGYFKGLSFGSFDGILQEIDARGAFVRGRLILSAGAKEIDCVFKQDEIPVAVRNFNKRARVDALAHYDGISPLPVRLDVKAIHPTKSDPDLLKWRGAFQRPPEVAEAG